MFYIDCKIIQLKLTKQGKKKKYIDKKHLTVG